MLHVYSAEAVSWRHSMGDLGGGLKETVIRLHERGAFGNANCKGVVRCCRHTISSGSLT